MRVIYRNPVGTKNLAAQPATSNHYDKILRDRVDVMDDKSGRLVARLVPGVLDPSDAQRAADAMADIEQRMAPSTTRRQAAGEFDWRSFGRDDIVDGELVSPTSGRLVRKDGHVIRQVFSNPVTSYVAGYTVGRFNGQAGPAALTAQHPDVWEQLVPVFAPVSEALREHLPDVWERHAQRVAPFPELTIPGTVLSTVAVNVNYASCFHRDRGDFKDGYSSVTVLPGDYDGGLLVFPGYRVAFDVRPLDVIFFQAHVDLHGNTAVTRGRRLSLVTYLKHRIAECESAASSPASADSSSGSSEPSPEPGPSGKSRSTPSVEPSSPSTGLRLVDSTTSEPSTPESSTPSISSAADSPAKERPTRVDELVSKIIEAVSGSTSSASFGSYDPQSQSLRTAVDSPQEASTLSSKDLPKAGMMRSGSLYALPTLERLTDEPASGLWPTPTYRDSIASRRHGYMKKGNSGTTLTDAVVIHHGAAIRKPGEHLPSEVAVNPAFSEALMGFTPNWTVPESAPSATPLPPKSPSSSDE